MADEKLTKVHLELAQEQTLPGMRARPERTSPATDYPTR